MLIDEIVDKAPHNICSQLSEGISSKISRKLGGALRAATLGFFALDLLIPSFMLVRGQLWAYSPSLC
jgi:hypothetical protein